MKARRIRFFSVLGCLLIGLASGSAAPAAEPPPAQRSNDAAEELAPDSSALDRATAVDLAIANSPEVRAALHRLGRAQGNRWTTQSRALPQLTASGSLQHRSEGLIDRAPPTDAQEDAIERALEVGQDPPPTSEVPITQDSYNTKIEVSQSLFAGFENYYGWRSANRRVAAERLMALDTALSVVRNVQSLFDQVLLSRRVVELRAEQVARARELLAITRKRYESGRVREYEVLTARSRLARSEVDLGSARMNLRQASSRLRLTIGLDDESPGEPLPVVGTLAEESYAPTSSDDPLARDPRGTARWTALASLSEAADFDLSATELKIVPRVEGFANYQSNSSYYDFESNLHGWAVGLTVQWNIFDGMRQRGERRVALANRREADENLRSFALNWRVRHAEALERLRTSAAMLEAEREAVDLMEESRRQIFRLFELGNLDQEQVLRADNELAAARLRQIEALYRHNDAVHELRYLTGADEERVSTRLASMEEGR